MKSTRPRIKTLALFLLMLAAPAFAKPNGQKPSPSPEEIKARDSMERLRKAEERMLCLADQSRFQAEIQRRSSQCEAKASEHRQCVARVRDRQSSNTGKGALIGLGAAILTGGASLLYTGAGALIGHETSDEAPNECGAVPNCDGNAIAESVAHETGMRRRDCPSA